MRAATANDRKDRWWKAVLDGTDLVVTVPEDFSSENYLRVRCSYYGITCNRLFKNQYLLSRREES